MKSYDVRTTVISPGAVATELPESITEPEMAQNIRQYFSQPEDVDVKEILFRPTRQEL